MKPVSGTILCVSALLLGASGVTQAAWSDQVTFGGVTLSVDLTPRDSGRPAPSESETPSPTSEVIESDFADRDDSSAVTSPEPTRDPVSSGEATAEPEQSREVPAEEAPTSAEAPTSIEAATPTESATGEPNDELTESALPEVNE